ncbi:MAG: hypothetical protein NC324_10720 [Bacteroides sp.]|nr:hypothetical protein [Bacteroides sp.]
MKKTHWLLLITLTSLFTSCCLHREKARVQLTNEQEQWLPPYQQDSVVSFIDRSGNPVDFVVVSRERFWNHWDIIDGAMCSDYALFETEKIILQSSDNDCELIVWMSPNAKDVNNVLTWDGSCELKIDYYGNEYWNVWLNFDKDGTVSATFHESFAFNNHVYHDVIEQRYYTEDDQKIGELLYNKDYGIIRLKKHNHLFLLDH